MQCDDLKDKIQKAKSLVGKYIQLVDRKGIAIGEALTWNIAYKGESVDNTINKYLTKHDYCVYVSYNSRDKYNIMIDDVELYKSEVAYVPLITSRVQAEIGRERVIIGSHTITRAELAEIVRVQEDMQFIDVKFKWEQYDDPEETWEALYVNIEGKRWFMAYPVFGTEDEVAIKKKINENKSYWKNFK